MGEHLTDLFTHEYMLCKLDTIKLLKIAKEQNLTVDPNVFGDYHNLSLSEPSTFGKYKKLEEAFRTLKNDNKLLVRMLLDTLLASFIDYTIPWDKNEYLKHRLVYPLVLEKYLKVEKAYKYIKGNNISGICNDFYQNYAFRSSVFHIITGVTKVLVDGSIITCPDRKGTNTYLIVVDHSPTYTFISAPRVTFNSYYSLYLFMKGQFSQFKRILRFYKEHADVIENYDFSKKCGTPSYRWVVEKMGGVYVSIDA